VSCEVARATAASISRREHKDVVFDHCQPKRTTFSMNLISLEQCRAARAMLGWSQGDLADAAKVSRTTVVDFERALRTPHRNNLDAIRRAFEKAGIEFIPENGGGAGLRLAKPSGQT
jgi:DNA-binding XRE family transcriptional regulator